VTTYLADIWSKCCDAPVAVEGVGTQFWRCTGCGQACDAAPREGKREAREAEA
jgi:hypothetical protein